MIYTKNGTEALQKRGVVISPGTGIEHWGTVFFGPRSSTGVAPGPQATMSDGSLDKDGQDLPLWSMVVVESNEDGFEIRAGKKGLEALVLQYPREDE